MHESTPPNPWANYQRCLIYEGDASHLLVIQDDAIPAPGFVPAVEKIADRWPETPICLFLGALPATTAVRVRRAKPDVRYVHLSPASFVPLVAVLWPTPVARHFADWSVTARGMTICDDNNASLWMKRTKQQIMVAVPSIVQHDDSAESVKGGRPHTPWQETWRFAMQLAEDCSQYDW